MPASPEDPVSPARASGGRGSPPPLSGDQRRALEEASTRLRRLLRPARIATVSAWTVGIFGGLTVLWGLLSGGGGVLVGVALLAVAYNEVRGRDRLRTLDPEGARILGWNQLLLLAVVAAYCVAAIVRARVAPSASTRQLEEAGLLEPGLVADLTALVYGAVLVGVGAAQAALARYHFGRRKAVEAFRRSTPDWVLDVLRDSGAAAG